jgi:hypothetical protein
MSNELEGFGQTGLTTYALIKRRGQFWDGSAFVNYVTADRNNYAITLAELGDASGQFQGNFPTGITDSGTYSYIVYQSSDGTVTEVDTFCSSGEVDWTGSGAANAAVGAMTGSDLYDYILRTFKRTDKSTEVYEAITDTIRDLRLRYHFDGATQDSVTTDSITTLGDFKIDFESSLGMLLGVTLQDGTTAKPLRLRTKQQFDEKYPDINVTSDTGYPEDYCLWEGALYIGPIPQSVAYSYRLSWSERGGTVTSSTAAVPFTAIDREVVKHGALSRLGVLLENANMATVHEGLYQSRIQVNIDRERKNRGEGHFLQRPFVL